MLQFATVLPQENSCLQIRYTYFNEYIFLVWKIIHKIMAESIFIGKSQDDPTRGAKAAASGYSTENVKNAIILSN
jgi:hypothetical protein